MQTDRTKSTTQSSTWVDYAFRIGCLLFLLLTGLGLWLGPEHGKDVLNLACILLFAAGLCRALFGDVLRGTGIVCALVAVVGVIAIVTL